MSRHSIESVILGVLGAAILYVAARYPALGPLLGLGYTLLLWPSLFTRWRRPFLVFYGGFFAFVLAIHLALLQYGWPAPLLLPLLLGLHFGVLPALTILIRNATGWPAFVVLPIAFGAEQWVRPMLGVGNFSMYEVGTFLFDYPLLTQPADLIGSLGLSVLAGVVWGGLTEIVHWRLESRGDGRHRAVAGALAAALVLVFTLCYSGWRLSQQAALPGLRVALIQPSQDHEDQLTAANVGELQRLTAQAVAPGSVDLVVWPENAIFTPYERNYEYRGSVEWVTRSRRAWLLFGTQSTDPSGTRPAATALLATPQGDVVGRYDKRILFPFTERLAFPWLAALSPAADEAVRRWTAAAWGSAPDGQAGTESTVFNIDTVSRPARIWTPLCYDICYPEIARQAIERGAAMFVNISSEGWNGPGVTNSYVGSTVLRAVENRVGVARCGNTGVSGLFSATGRIEQLLVGKHGRTVLDVGVLVGDVSRDSRWPTVYAQYGGAIDRVPALFAAIAIGFGWYRRRYKRDRIRDSS